MTGILSVLSRHKKTVFIYIPVLVCISMILYTGIVYMQWIRDRDMALTKLARYKSLIDRTEELRKGYTYSYSDIDLSAKVVDIPTRIFDRHGEIIGEFFEQKREIVPYDYIPPWLVKAVIASEDRDFYNHEGISYKGIARALLVNIIHFRVVQGGSTITQQLAKVLFTDMQRNLKRKIYEAFCACEIEERYDKQDILSMYLNLIYFGNGAYGVESTARMFFGRSVRELKEVECSMIVATISNPQIYSPLNNLDNSVKKTRRILTSLVDAGYIAEKRAEYQYNDFLDKWDISFNEEGDAVSSLIGSTIYSSYRINRAPFFNERIRRMLVDRFAEETVKKGGLEVHTTIDAGMQEIALHELRKGIDLQREYHRERSKIFRNKHRSQKELLKAENIEGALVTLDPYTGEIRAYAGGSQFSAENQNDHVSQIRRQPGSSFKPVVYAAAVEAGDITPSTMFVDERTEFEGEYTPENYGKTYQGKIIVREALRKSINVIAVKVLEKTGYDGVMKIVRETLGLSDREMRERFGKTLSLALGSYEVSPMENCQLHAVLVNGGDFIIPYGIRFVRDYNGNVVWDREREVQEKVSVKRKEKGKIIDPVSASVIISMLQGVVEPGGTASSSVRYRDMPYQIAGKTGTSTDFVDAWFVGYTSQTATAVWFGNKSGAISLGEGRTGGVVAAPVWAAYMETYYSSETVKPGPFHVPQQGVSRETICLGSGDVAGREGQCPETAVQLYHSGTEPGHYCRIHGDLTVPPETIIGEKGNED